MQNRPDQDQNRNKSTVMSSRRVPISADMPADAALTAMAKEYQRLAGFKTLSERLVLGAGGQSPVGGIEKIQKDLTQKRKVFDEKDVLDESKSVPGVELFSFDAVKKQARTVIEAAVAKANVAEAKAEGILQTLDKSLTAALANESPADVQKTFNAALGTAKKSLFGILIPNANDATEEQKQTANNEVAGLALEPLMKAAVESERLDRDQKYVDTLAMDVARGRAYKQGWRERHWGEYLYGKLGNLPVFGQSPLKQAERELKKLKSAFEDEDNLDEKTVWENKIKIKEGEIERLKVSSGLNVVRDDEKAGYKKIWPNEEIWPKATLAVTIARMLGISTPELSLWYPADAGGKKLKDETDPEAMARAEQGTPPEHDPEKNAFDAALKLLVDEVQAAAAENRACYFRNKTWPDLVISRSVEGTWSISGQKGWFDTDVIADKKKPAAFAALMDMIELVALASGMPINGFDICFTPPEHARGHQKTYDNMNETDIANLRGALIIAHQKGLEGGYPVGLDAQTREMLRATRARAEQDVTSWKLKKIAQKGIRKAPGTTHESSDKWYNPLHLAANIAHWLSTKTDLVADIDALFKLDTECAKDYSEKVGRAPLKPADQAAPSPEGQPELAPLNGPVEAAAQAQIQSVADKQEDEFENDIQVQPVADKKEDELVNGMQHSEWKEIAEEAVHILQTLPVDGNDENANAVSLRALIGDIVAADTQKSLADLSEIEEKQVPQDNFRARLEGIKASIPSSPAPGQP